MNRLAWAAESEAADGEIPPLKGQLELMLKSK